MRRLTLASRRVLVPLTSGDVRAIFLGWTEAAGADGGAGSYTGKLEQALFKSGRWPARSGRTST